jgi:RNA polymerase sigma-70 factor (ECF subfamily)
VSDDELVLEARRGSREAFEGLFDRYRGPIWQFFRRRVTETARAEELTQDTFVALLEGLRRYEARTAFRAYLFGIASHLLSADRRKATHRRTDPLDFDPAGRGSDHDADLWVRRALAQLDDDTREILMLREYDELSYQEIADLRQVPVNTVRSRLFRARMALRAALVPEADSVRARR